MSGQSAPHDFFGPWFDRSIELKMGSAYDRVFGMRQSAFWQSPRVIGPWVSPEKLRARCVSAYQPASSLHCGMSTARSVLPAKTWLGGLCRSFADVADVIHSHTPGLGGVKGRRRPVVGEYQRRLVNLCRTKTIRLLLFSTRKLSSSVEASWSVPRCERSYVMTRPTCFLKRDCATCLQSSIGIGGRLSRPIRPKQTMRRTRFVGLLTRRGGQLAWRSPLLRV